MSKLQEAFDRAMPAAARSVIEFGEAIQRAHEAMLLRVSIPSWALRDDRDPRVLAAAEWTALDLDAIDEDTTAREILRELGDEWAAACEGWSRS